MLEIRRRSLRVVPAFTRRNWLRAGALTASCSLAPWGTASRAATLERRRDSAVILFWMAGGPSHLDTYDLKPAAPLEVRGPFAPIATSTPGFSVCDLLPRHAPIADKFSIVHGITHEYSVHDDAQHLVQTGHPLLNARQRGQQHPAEGAVVSHLRGANRADAPAYVCIPEDYARHAGFYQQAAFLGSQYNALNAGGDPSLGNYRPPEFVLPEGLNLARLAGRRELLRQIDAWRADAAESVIEDADLQRRRAYDLVSGAAAREAFHLEREPAAVRERYGRNFYGQSALLARRLVEAGATFVTINLYEKDVDWWDDHYTIEKNLRKRLPIYDQALSTLIADLAERGQHDRVLVAAYGDFGRAPRIDAGAGRGHWPKAMSALLAGGGVRGGQVVGATTANGGEPADRPFSPGDLLASVYHTLGIDPLAELKDRQNRPVRPIENGAPIAELF